MRTKFTLCSVVVVYIAITVLLCVVVWERHAGWSQHLRVSLNVGIISIVKILVWGNIVGILLFLVVYVAENIRYRKLTRKNKTLEGQVTDLKAKLVDSHPTHHEESVHKKPHEAPQGDAPTSDNNLT